MPTYVYACDTCGKQFEKFQSFKDAPITTCSCGESGSVRRVIQPAGIVFKGSGWYLTDSRNTTSSSVDTPKDKSESGGESTSNDSTSSTSDS
jgi:putative FmdB family regulatory protein